MKLVGKVLWWSKREENGVVVDAKGNEFYFDRSVLSGVHSSRIRRGIVILFEPSTCDNVKTARQIEIPTQGSARRHLRQFEIEQNQFPLPLLTNKL